MFEEKTQEHIVAEMKRDILTKDPNIDVREGSLIHTAISPVAFELMQAYMNMNYTLRNVDPNTCDREFLVAMAKNRGITPQPPTKAYYTVSPEVEYFDGLTGVCNGQKLIFIDSSTCYTENTGSDMNELINYAWVTLSTGKYTTLTELKTPATDEEDLESLRKRYFLSYRGKGFNGNKIAYQEKALENPNVGLASVNWRDDLVDDKIYIYLLSRTLDPVTEDIIESVQNVIDPRQDGLGTGFAPIGHKVVVKTFTETLINLTYEVKLAVGSTITDIDVQIKSILNKYFKNFVYDYFNGSPNPNSYVVATDRLESEILKLSKDILTVTVWFTDNKKTNTYITMNTSVIPKVGTLTLHTEGDGMGGM